MQTQDTIGVYDFVLEEHYISNFTVPRMFFNENSPKEVILKDCIIINNKGSSLMSYLIFIEVEATLDGVYIEWLDKLPATTWDCHFQTLL